MSRKADDNDDDDGSLKDEEAYAIAKRVQAIIHEMVGVEALPAEPIAAADESDESAQSRAAGEYIRAEADHLQKIITRLKDSINFLKDSQGDQSVMKSLPEIWHLYASRPDKDNAMLMAAHVHRYNVAHLHQIYEEQFLVDLDKMVKRMQGIARNSLDDEDEDDEDGDGDEDDGGAEM